MQCEAFAFHTSVSKHLGEKSQLLSSAEHNYVRDPSFLLSLHGFCVEMKSTIICEFPLILQSLISKFAKENKVDGVELPSPPSLIGEARPDWLLTLQEKVLFNNTFMQDSGDSDDKCGGSKGAVAR